MSLTATQQQAVAARGNVLVVAGAGTGKTRTLVERCVACLVEKPRASLDELLMVTFTDAAAAEMRQRIRVRLEQERQAHLEDPHWPEQLALFETAHIGTLHSFCLQLVRQHFYELELDPQLSVLAEEETRLLADETLEALLEKHYAGRGKTAEAVQHLIQAQGRGWDRPIRALVLRLHHYTQTLPDPAGWIEAQLAGFGAPEPTLWQAWLLDSLADWRDRWLPLLEEKGHANDLAARCAAALRQLKSRPTRPEAAAALEILCAVPKDVPHGKKTAWLAPLEPFLAECNFLFSLAQAKSVPVPGPDPSDPLAQDWAWVRAQMTTLLRLAREFTAAFTDAKRELGVVDFHDLEQHALRLLWDAQANQPTKIACQWRSKLRFVFVDEYQDINAAQDKIIDALSRGGPQANRFLVGDVKQSIYRFRLANPYIFQGYIEQWNHGAGTTIPLVDNFRSRERLLDCINSFFGLVMRREVGGVPYDDQARLRFGAPAERHALSVASNPAPAVELHLRLKGNPDPREETETEAEAMAELKDLEEAEKEARLVALRLRELKAQSYPVWDEAAGQFRPVDWRDIVVLLRSPAHKAESYAKAFSRLNVPLQVARGGFYQSLEISDLLSLLQLLDNPLQDLPVLAVLHSPLVGLTLDELATIRLTLLKARYWTALVRWHESRSAEGPESKIQNPKSSALESEAPPNSDAAASSGDGSLGTTGASLRTPHSALHPDAASETFRKVDAFLERFARWRRLARQVSLSGCLEAVLSETHYATWLLTQPRGDQRHANVQRLLGLAQQFDRFQRQGLFRFLRFIEAQQLAETEPDVAPVSEENAVRLMSIHQSKGLEFPVVVVADLAKPFNLSDLRAEIILDEAYGLCPQIKPPHTGKRYPSLPYWLACRRQQRELRGEELRLLYVAMTRARDLLLLSASVSAASFNKLWQQKTTPSPENGSENGSRRREEADPIPILTPAATVAENSPTRSETLLAARSYADWLGPWFARQRAGSTPESETNTEAASHGGNPLLRWFIHDDTKLLGADSAASPAVTGIEPDLTAEPGVWQELQQRLAWKYPYIAATRQPAKTSVSVLRRRAALASDEEAIAPFIVQGSMFSETQALGPAASKKSAADVGTAHHTFLEFVALERTGSLAALEQEASRLQNGGVLSADQTALLDLKALTAFWTSDLGRKVRDRARFVRRELPFTARFAPDELARLTGEPPDPTLEDEFVVVQGVADLAVILPEEIWLVDFKTDRFESPPTSRRVRSAGVSPAGSKGVPPVGRAGSSVGGRDKPAQAAHQLPPAPESLAGSDPGLNPALAEKVNTYAPQLELYARALSRIYSRPVSHCWLYFLAAQTAVEIPPT